MTVIKSLPQQWSSWYNHLPGKQLLALEQQIVCPQVQKFTGQRLLQIGGPNRAYFVQGSPIKERIYLTRDYSHSQSMISLCGDYLALPLMDNCIDLILIVHVLEYEQEPLPMLKEIEKVLAPQGHLILLTFNPISLWKLPMWRRSELNFPLNFKYLPAWRLTSWLQEINFDVLLNKSIFFRPPVSSAKWLNRLLFMESLGQLLWSSLGAVNILIAQKKVTGLTPLKTRWVLKSANQKNSYLEPTTRFKR